MSGSSAEAIHRIVSKKDGPEPQSKHSVQTPQRRVGALGHLSAIKQTEYGLPPLERAVVMRLLCG